MCGEYLRDNFSVKLNFFSPESQQYAHILFHQRSRSYNAKLSFARQDNSRNFLLLI